MIRAYIYARVSKDAQDNAMQLHDLRNYANRNGWTVTEWTEKESSVKRRPVFQSMLEEASRGKCDVILVWRLDRFARSMKDFVLITQQLDAWGVRLISVTEGMDTGDANPFAEFQRGLLALLAQLERKIIVARVKAGVAEAKRQGKHCGRPTRVWRRDEAAALRRAGMSWRGIARKIGVPEATIRLALNGAQKV